MNEVILYVVPNCPLCAEVRQILRKHKIEFVERDVKNEHGALRAMYRLTRQGLVPVVEKNGKALVRPTEPQLLELLR